MASSSINSSKRGSEAEALPPAFYERDTRLVARELLGKVLEVRDRGSVKRVRIVETEAYGGPGIEDPAAHSHRGETPRARVMFGEPGRAYVYFIYGMYEMLNFVTESRGVPGAVLIRAGEPLGNLSTEGLLATNGPGKLCRALGIRLSDNDLPLQGPRLRVLDDGFRPAKVMCSPRVGIREAKDFPWRYYSEGSLCVSKAPQNKIARIWEAGV